ncbi:MAG: hypothetical protein ACI9IP_003324 [Arcticibacterium sp.]|jgi:hypothetical protein
MIQFVTTENQKLPYSALGEFGLKNAVKIKFHENSNYKDFVKVGSLAVSLECKRELFFLIRGSFLFSQLQY